jgi:apolipoprotein N-acyltransferase
MYFKRYLTPFGEYVPLRKLSEFISPFASRVDDFEAGTAEKVHSVDGMKISSIICFEIINDGIVREAAKLGGLLVVHTNSATFAGTAEGDQQLAITRLRSLEHARSIVSISTTGPSAIINERGVVIDSLRDGEIGSLSGSLEPSTSITMSDRLGGFAPVTVIAISALWAFSSFYRGRKFLQR